jgi:hypothetical protein
MFAYRFNDIIPPFYNADDPLEAGLKEQLLKVDNTIE